MAGTANNWRVAGRAIGSGILWGGLAIPAAGARLTLAAADADGFVTPDATANPNAFAFGATKAGAKLMAKATRQDFFVDEIPAPIDTKLTAMETAISTELAAVNDYDIVKILAAGFGTYSTASGYKQLTLGTVNDAFQSIALIFPTREDPTKVAVWHLYKAINDAGLDFTVGDKEMAFTPTNFKGYAIASRARADQFGNYWTVTA